MKKSYFAPIMLGLCLSPHVNALALSLTDIVQYTLDHNPDVLADVHEKKAREQEIRQAQAGYYPVLDVTYGVGWEDSSNSTTRDDFKDGRELIRKERALNLRQMLFDGYATDSEVRRQKARVSSQQYRTLGTAGVTSLRTIEVYLAILRGRQRVLLGEDNLAFHQQTYDQIKLRSDAGVGRKADLDQVNGRVALSQSNLSVERSNLIDAQTNYMRVVGNFPPAELELPEQPSDLPDTIEHATDIALTNNPTLKSANADILATFAQHESARAAFFPRVDLEVGKTWNEDLDGQRGTNEDATVILRVRYNLLNGGNDRARKKQTAILIEESKQVRNQTYRQVVESIRLSWNAYQATKMQLPYLRMHVESSLKSREAYRQQFNIGKRTLLDVLDAENELFQAKQAQTNAEFDHLFAGFRTLAGMGVILRRLKISVPDVTHYANP